MNIPRATYRLQFHSGFTFDSALAIAEYLQDLGISHVYASPILQAKKGSMHGYDMTDPTVVNAELGTEKKFDELIDKIQTLDMGWIQDIVPNHMAFDSENKLLMDVFEKGQLSEFNNFFDINWDHPYANLRGKTLVPFLGDFYGHCLKKGEITLAISEQGFFIKYYELKLPVSLSTYQKVLNPCLELLAQTGSEDQGSKEKISYIIKLFSQSDLSSPNALALAKAELWRAYQQEQGFRDVLQHRLDKLNLASAESLEEFHGLLAEQHFRLSFWKVGNDELNYRRFFTVNQLICLKAEDPDVFDFTHRKIFDLVDQGKINGVRLDHIDGLHSPLVYLRRLRDKLETSYIIVEKILCENETMPLNWPIQGTTGYDFLNYVNWAFVDDTAKQKIHKIYASFSNMQSDFESLVVEKKRLFMGKHMAGDIDNLAHLLKNILVGNIQGSDFTMYGLRRALVEVMAHFPVYRTYVSELGISESDTFFIKQSLEKARRSGKDLAYELDAIEKILLMDSELSMSDEVREMCRHFTRRFQQFTGALMAKGAEDTAAYIYNRLISLNEVGGFPDQFGISIDAFHDFHYKRAKAWPYSMNCTATHDTKRGEDVRARINVLSEIPEQWGAVLKKWHRFNRKHKTKIDREQAPSKNDEYFIYQTLIGALPFLSCEMEEFKQRIKEYIVKAVREAKIHTAWLKPDKPYEEACMLFIDKILDVSRGDLFLDDLIVFQKKIAHFGILNSLSQLLVKMTAPGVPDIYQGNELWDFHLVDPDNRRPVDFTKRQQMLKDIRSKEGDLPALISELIAEKEDGRIKMFMLYRLLRTKKEFRSLFQDGEYIALKVEGACKDNVIAFARKDEHSCGIVLASRFFSKIANEGQWPLGEQAWKNTAVVLPQGFCLKYTDIFTGQEHQFQEKISIAKVLNLLPSSLMVGHV